MNTVCFAVPIIFELAGSLPANRLQNDRYVYVAYSRQFGFEHSGGKFQLVGGGGCPIEAFLRIRYVEGGKSFVLDEMEQLRGHVTILNERDALRFVRLRTAPDTFRLREAGQRLFGRPSGRTEPTRAKPCESNR
jgi:hypothetical protein